MKKAMPDGGKCMGFVGLPGADNARERVEGIKRGNCKGTKIELVDVRADDIDHGRAPSANVEDTMTARIPRSTAWSASIPTTRRRFTKP